MIGLDLTDGAPPHDGVFPQAGSLEVLASGRALDQLARGRGERRRQLVPRQAAHPRGRRDRPRRRSTARARATRPSVRCLRILGERLGIGIANAITMFDPLEVVIGGGVSAAGELLLGPARETAWKYAVPGAGLAVRDPPRPPRAARRRARRGAARGAGVRGGHRRRDGGGGGGPMRIACAFDHAGFPLKPLVLETVRRARARGDRPRDVLDRPGRLPRHGARGARGGPRAARPTARSWCAAPAPASRSPPASSLASARRARTTRTRRTRRRARRRQRALPGRARDRPGARRRGHRARSCARSSAARSATCAGWGRSTAIEREFTSS